MRFYLHAFCLDEAKAQEGFEQVFVGPFDWVSITWDFLRAGRENIDKIDEQFVRHQSGFWYQVAHLDYEGIGSTQPDPRRGRFTDITILPEDKLLQTLSYFRAVISPNAAVEIPPGYVQFFPLDWANENAWLDNPGEDAPEERDELAITHASIRARAWLNANGYGNAGYMEPGREKEMIEEWRRDLAANHDEHGPDFQLPDCPRCSPGFEIVEVP